MTVLLLPIPPSSNNLFPTGSHGGRFKSPEYKVWLNAAGWQLKQQRFEAHRGKIEAVYEYGRYPDNRRRDLANREKALSDLLVTHGIIEDDCLIQRLTLAWSNLVPPGNVRVTIENWTE